MLNVKCLQKIDNIVGLMMLMCQWTVFASTIVNLFHETFFSLLFNFGLDFFDGSPLLCTYKVVQSDLRFKIYEFYEHILKNLPFKFVYKRPKKI